MNKDEIIEHLSGALMDEETWRWWEDLEDDNSDHDWDKSLAFFVVPERSWYVVCGCFDAFAQVDPSPCGSFVTIEYAGGEDAGCELDPSRHYDEFDCFIRILMTPAEIEAFKKAIGWEDRWRQ